MTDQRTPDPPKGDRDARLGAALRANLAKRRGRARALAEAPPRPDPTPPEDD